MTVRMRGVLDISRTAVLVAAALAGGCTTFDGEARDAERRGDLRHASAWYAQHIDEHGAPARAGLDRCGREWLRAACAEASAAHAEPRVALAHYEAALEAVGLCRENGIALALPPEDRVGLERAAAAVAAAVEQAAASGAWLEAAADLDTLPALGAQRLGPRRCAEIQYRAAAALAADGAWRLAYARFGHAGEFEDAKTRRAECLARGSLLVRVEPTVAEGPVDTSFVDPLAARLADRVAAELREEDDFVAVSLAGTEPGRAFGRTVRVRLAVAAVESAEPQVRTLRGWVWSGSFGRDAQGHITGLDGLEAVQLQEIDGVRAVEVRAALEIDGSRVQLDPVRAEEPVHRVLGGGAATYLMRVDPTPMLRDHFDELEKVPDFAVPALLARVLDGVASLSGSQLLVDSAVRGSGSGRAAPELMAVCAAEVAQQAARRVAAAVR